MTSTALKERVLLVDDEPQILTALEDLLADDFLVLKSRSAQDALELIANDAEIAVVVTDQRMPVMTGADLLAQLGSKCPALRIMVSGFADLPAVVRAVNEGKIFAYVPKPWDADDLRLKIRHAAGHFRLAQELARERKLLQDQTVLLHAILEGLAEGVVVIDRQGKTLLFNREAKRMLCAESNDARPSEWAERFGLYLADRVTPLPSKDNPLARAIEGERLVELEVFVKNAEIREGALVITATPLRAQHGVVVGAIALLRDVTRQRSLEQQLAQAQKMDAIGQLAGGVAHDFNNLLSVIEGCGELVFSDMTEGDPRREDVSEILSAARRASSLTRQLLALSRRQVSQPSPQQLNQIVSATQGMLRRVLGQQIQLVSSLAPELGLVSVDTSQIEQVILNLVVNARDAMPNGGTVQLRTFEELLSEEESAASGAKPGTYIALVVSDTGVGMSPEVQRRIFEPFYTTKEIGKGTGLGLSTVYGIVSQNGGYLTVQSEPGLGATFKAAFPIADDCAVPGEARPERTPLASVAATVLVVEDDDAVRRLAARFLRQEGYQVIEASLPSVALGILAGQERIDCLLTDVAMPEMTGAALAARVAQGQPELAIVYMSGDAGAVVDSAGNYALRDSFVVEKPFSRALLLDTVRGALGARSAH